MEQIGMGACLHTYATLTFRRGPAPSQRDRRVVPGSDRRPDRGKRLAGDTAVASKAEAGQAFADRGKARRLGVERPCRDSEITQKYEGAIQVQRMIFLRRLMKNGARA